jgi:hypothetical protein
MWAWNVGMLEPVTDTVQFTVYEPGTCVPLTSVTILGATSGAPGSYTFSLDYTPSDATPPFTYLWDNGDTTATSQRSLGAGTHTITVTMTNCSGVQVTDTHIITITGPLNQIWLPFISKMP